MHVTINSYELNFIYTNLQNRNDFVIWGPIQYKDVIFITIGIPIRRQAII